ncbi:protoporphyrinogen/coproporphyrinogen oxidase [Actinocatenispora rupis]|uniref:Oxidoreductase n=1 Tax=Actinocatenispora rupis TaxID=519421 RepID=A0A8J3IYK3_9ACTN|nr:FAD-dependent oxidoreductase [Actinocatenispora rupis]GID11018.1 oxidoreductase [Actinocatenispora rupis]
MSGELDVAVVGAGIAGLSVAYALRRSGRRVRVYEAADAVGGRMRTERRDGYRIDTGAEMLSGRGYPATWRMIRRLGLTPADVPRIDGGLALWRNGKARRNAGRPLGLLTGAGMSVRGRLAMLRFGRELAAAPDPEHPERSALAGLTVADLAERYDPELAAAVLRPLVGGFFGALPDTFGAAPLVAHLAAVGDPTRWRTYAGGMDRMARELAGRVDVTTGTPVESVRAADGGVVLSVHDGEVRARAAVLAVPAPVAAALHPEAPADEAEYLAASTYAPMLRVAFLLDRPLRPTGSRAAAVLVRGTDNPHLAVLTVDHHKAIDRAPLGRGLVTAIASPAASRLLLSAPDCPVAALLAEQAERYVPGLAPAIRATVVHRFPYGLPECTPTALARREAFLRRPVRPVEYAGDWVLARPCSEGAVRSAELAVPRVLSMVDSPVVVGA